MHIAYLGPISLRLLSDRLQAQSVLPKGYQYPLGAYLVEQLLDKGHQVTVITSVTELKSSSTWCLGPLKVIATPRRRHYLFCIDNYLRERRSMRAALEQVNPDIIHAQWNYEFAHAAIDSGFPYLVTARDSAVAIMRHMPSPYRYYRLRYARKLIPRIRNLSTISPYMAHELKEHFNRSYSSTQIVPNGLKDELFQKKTSWRFQGSDPTVAMISGWGPRKNAKVGLRAFQCLRTAYPGARLLLLGGELGHGEKGHEWARNHGCADGVAFLGAVDHEATILKLRNEADLLVHTTLEESFCMVVVEAMAQGLPVVAGISSGAVPWVLDEGKAGLLVDCHDAEAVGAALKRLCASESLRAKIGQSGFSHAWSAFRLSKVAANYEKAYGEVLSAW